MSGGLLGGNGTWDTAGNWSSAAIPVDDDTATMPASQTNDIIGPTGANRNVDLDVLHSHPGYLGSVGASGVPILLAADLVHVQGAGSFFFESHQNAGDVSVTDEVRIEAALSTSRVEIGSNPADTDSDIALVNCLRGDITLTGNIKFPAAGVVVVGEVSGAEDATVRIVNTADTLADFIQTSGRSFVDNIVTRLGIAGGVCVKDVNKVITIDVFRGGTLIYNHGASAGDVIVCRVHTGGVLDLNQNGLLKEFDQTIRYRGGIIHSTAALHTLNLLDIEREG